MRNQLMTILGGALVLSLGLVPMAFAGYFNGPDLTSTRIKVTGGGQSCDPWDCGLNGPDLTGTRIEIEGTETRITVPTNPRGGTSCDPWDCGLNGPDLTGMRIHSKTSTIQVTVPTPPKANDDDDDFGAGTGGDTCLPGSGCPTNGTDLTGIRVPTHHPMPIGQDMTIRLQLLPQPTSR